MLSFTNNHAGTLLILSDAFTVTSESDDTFTRVPWHFMLISKYIYH